MSTSAPSPHLLRNALRFGGALAILAIVLACWGIFSRIQAHAALTDEANKQRVIPVSVSTPGRGGAEELILPGTLQAFTETPIYARTSGYLKRWYVDIGTRVAPGQLMAEIDTPEVDQQTRQAEADLKTAEANNNLAQITAQRWRNLLPTNSVSRQDVDNKIGDAAAKEAAVASARANLQRLRELESFKRIVSPVHGVVTVRNTDIGDLIDAGTGSGAAHELFHVADTRQLRLYVPVPESYAEDMHVGNIAILHVREHPGQTYKAKIVNTASAITAGSHTLTVQLAVDNRSGTLLPGGFVEVHFGLAQRANTLRISANSLIFGTKGLRVAVVNNDNHVVMQTVTLGRDFGNEVEVLDGLKPEQLVVVNPLDSLEDGQTVTIVPASGSSKDNK